MAPYRRFANSDTHHIFIFNSCNIRHLPAVEITGRISAVNLVKKQINSTYFRRDFSPSICSVDAAHFNINVRKTLMRGENNKS